MEELRGVFVLWIILYIIALQLIGYLAYRRATPAAEDFWVMGRKLGGHAGGMSYLATFISGVTFLGFTGSIYNKGYFLVGAVVLGLVLGNVLGYILAPKIREIGGTSLGDVMASLVPHPWTQKVVGTITLFELVMFLLINLIGASLVVSFLLGWPYFWTLTLISAAFIAYTTVGGLRAVVWTDIIQGTIMIGGALVATILLVNKGGGLTAVHTKLSELKGYLDAFPPGITVLAFLASTFTFLHLFLNQYTIVRINAAKNSRHARLMLVVGTLGIALFYPFIIIFGGGAARVFGLSVGLDVVKQDLAMVQVLSGAFPPIMATIFLLAIMSAILSTTDSLLHALGVVTARDFYHGGKPVTDTKKSLIVTRIATVAWGTLAYLIATAQPGTIMKLYTYRSTVLTSAYLLPVLLMFYWGKHSPVAGVWAMIGGVLTGVIWFSLKSPGIPAVFLAAIVGGLLLIILSKLFPRKG